MKQFSLIYKDATPYLRVRNLIENDGRIISRVCWEEHEKAYINEAIKVLNPTPNQREYFGSELEMLWRYTENNGETWIETSEPNFIGTSPENYEQVFKVKLRKEIPYQERVKDWVVNTFSEEVMKDVPERCFRFMEESIELGQSLGVTREDMYRLITYTYGRPPGEVPQEIGGVMVTLFALSEAVGVNTVQAGETELASNWLRKDEIREKWLNKKVVSPL